MKKILLLTDIPPCSNYTAGLVLERLVKFLPSEKIAICSVVNPALSPLISKDLKKIPKLQLAKLREVFPRLLPKKMGGLISFVFELVQGLRVKYFLLPKIISFANEQKVDALWVVLQGQTIVRLAKPLSDKLKLPLYTQVWDPFEWWLREHRVDGYTSRRLLKTFDETIKHSASCATASWMMSEIYSCKYKVNNIPIIASLPVGVAKLPATKTHSKSEFIIAMAGQFYAKAEWECLISALNHVNWMIEGRKIRVRVMGSSLSMSTHSPVNIEYIGWHSQDNILNFLAASDLLYLPYWFSREFKLESTSSFPSKLVTYFAAGRPVFCHSPSYASPAQYVLLNHAGYLCNSLNKNIVLEKLQQVIRDEDCYAKFAENGAKCFKRDFTLESMKKVFFNFLEIKDV